MLLVGTGTARGNFFNTTGQQSLFEVETVGGPVGTFVLNFEGAAPGSFVIGKTRGTTSNSNVAVQASDGVGRLSFQASDGSEMVEAANIECYVDGTPGANDMPGRLVFCTTSDNAASPTERMRLTSAGRLGLGTSSPNERLHVSGKLLLNNGTNSYFDAASTNGLVITNPTAIRLEVGSERLRIDSSGRVGIGTTSPGDLLTLAGTSTYIAINNTTNNRVVYVGCTPAGDAEINAAGSNAIQFKTVGAERARIDSSGRLLVGTSSARTTAGLTPTVQVETGSYYAYSAVQNSNDNGGASVVLGKSRGTSAGGTTIVQNADTIGNIAFTGADGTNGQIRAAVISCDVDGTPGANDMPGRLVFSTTADGASSPTERMRITSGGHFKASDTGSYNSASATYHELRNSINNYSIYTANTNASFTSSVMLATTSKASANDYHFFIGNSGGSDDEFRLRGDGEAFADGAWTGGGADYAEYFEWSDGNPDADDRRGIAVVLDGDKIRPALAGEDPIGVISGNPSVVGDAAWTQWSGKYLRDDYGTYIQEDYEVEDEDGNTVIQQRRKLNPAYDPDVEYTSREQRPEWDCVGLMGKLRIRKGQPAGSRWIKMRDVSDSVEEWLVR
jgi:hypothetical protein